MIRFIMILSVLFASFSHAAITVAPLADCPGGKKIVATFDLDDEAFRSKNVLMVFNEGFKNLAQFRAFLKKRGIQAVAIINGGFFWGSQSVSYFKSTHNGYEHPHNSVRSPRACFFRNHLTNEMNILQSTPENHTWMKNEKALEAFCAGPQLIDGGLNVADEHYCSEQFKPDPKCRGDQSDSGLNYNGNTPRTASCITRDGKLKWFAYISDQRKCGIPIPEMTRQMMDEGCASAINHDGGGSSHLFLAERPDLPTGIGDRKSDGTGSDRPLPVWIAIIRK